MIQKEDRFFYLIISKQEDLLFYFISIDPGGRVNKTSGKRRKQWRTAFYFLCNLCSLKQGEGCMMEGKGEGRKEGREKKKEGKKEGGGQKNSNPN